MALNRQKVIRAAEKLVNRGRIEAAIDQYRKVVDKFPNDTNTLNRVGDLYARLDRIDEAIELFNQTARHFGREGFYVKAIAIYKKIIRLDPTQIEVYEQLADLYHRQGLISEARAQYEVVADYYQQQNDIPATVGIHQKMVELEPHNPSRRLRLAELFQQQGQLSDAMEQYRAIASLMLAHDRVEEAVQVCLKALEIDASDLNFIAGAVQEIRDAGHREEADRVLLAAIDSNPEAANIEQLAAAEAPPSADVQEAVVSEPETAAELEEAAADEAVEVEPPVTEPPPSAVVEEVEFELDLDELAAEPPTKEAPVEAEAVAPAAKFVVEEAPPAEEAIEEPAAEPEIDPRLSELLSESAVLAKYGLEDKAAERLEEALEVDPHRLDTYGRLIPLYARGGNNSRVVELANLVLEMSADLETSEVADQVSTLLTEQGFLLEDGRFSAPAVEPEEVEEPTAEPAEAVEEPTPQPQVEAELPTTPGVDVSWLEAPTSERPEADATVEALFSEEEEFFDLASELEEELLKEESLLDEELLSPQDEQSLEEIVDGFKKGMEETISAEDFDTHYNLGVAYREMGLLDEAIGEFQLAAKDSRYLIECCSLLAGCFREKGFPELAIKWYQRALESPNITDDENLGLVYELADLYLSMGDTEAARERFVEIYGINSNYRDVVAKLEELGHS